MYSEWFHYLLIRVIIVQELLLKKNSTSSKLLTSKAKNKSMMLWIGYSLFFFLFISTSCMKFRQCLFFSELTFDNNILLVQDGDKYALLYTTLLEKSVRIDTVQYVLVLVGDMLTGEQFFSCKVFVWSLRLRLSDFRLAAYLILLIVFTNVLYYSL